MFNSITARNLGIMNMNVERESDQERRNFLFSNSEGESSETMFLSYHLSEDTHSEDLWLLDSRCSNDMKVNKNILSYLDVSIE